MQLLQETQNTLKNRNCFHLVCTDAQHLPFRAESFDLVVCSEVIEHLLKPALLFKDVTNCLKRDGKLLLSTPNVIGLWNLIFDLWLAELMRAAKMPINCSVSPLLHQV